MPANLTETPLAKAMRRGAGSSKVVPIQPPMPPIAVPKLAAAKAVPKPAAPNAVPKHAAPKAEPTREVEVKIEPGLHKWCVKRAGTTIDLDDSPLKVARIAEKPAADEAVGSAALPPQQMAPVQVVAKAALPKQEAADVSAKASAAIPQQQVVATAKFDGTAKDKLNAFYRNMRNSPPEVADKWKQLQKEPRTAPQRQAFVHSVAMVASKSDWDTACFRSVKSLTNEKKVGVRRHV